VVRILIAFTFAAITTAQIPAPYPAPGKLIDVGGYRVHLHCTGEGSPAVVIVGAGFSFDWALVQTEAAKFTQVCTYDVSGTAWSDPGPSETCQQRVDEIQRLLKRAEVKGPYVLVGLSVGAVVTRLYAARHPEEVAGIVMVDHAFLNPTDSASHSGAITAPGLDSPPVLIHQEPIVFTVEETSSFQNLPKRSQDLHHWAMSLHPVLPSLEMAENCVAEVGKASLGNLLLAVVSTGNEAPNYPKLQAQLLALSRNSEQFIAAKSFHSVEIDQPDVVVRAIRHVVDAIRIK
jgi:pimeloyl-ACP methyl ester carboxylesterase